MTSTQRTCKQVSVPGQLTLGVMITHDVHGKSDPLTAMIFYIKRFSSSIKGSAIPSKLPGQYLVQDTRYQDTSLTDRDAPITSAARP
jgi:hypothetical protein